MVRNDVCYEFNKRYHKGLPTKGPNFGSQCRAYVPVEANVFANLNENKTALVFNATPAFGPSIESYGGKDKLYMSLKGNVAVEKIYSKTNEYSYEKPALAVGGVFETGAKFAIGADRWAENIFYVNPYIGADLTYEKEEMKETYGHETYKVDDLNAKAGGGVRLAFQNSAYKNVKFDAEIGADAGYLWSTNGTASTPDAAKKISDKIEQAPYVGINAKAGVTVHDAYTANIFVNHDMPIPNQSNLSPNTTVGVSCSVLLNNSSNVKPRRY